MPSASTKPAAASIFRTSRKPRTSSRRRAAPARSRNRFEVSLSSPTGPPPSLRCAASASFFFWKLSVAGMVAVEEVAGHRVARAPRVALGEHDLEEMRAAGGRAEHLGAAVQIHAPDPAEALAELPRVQGADA